MHSFIAADPDPNKEKRLTEKKNKIKMKKFYVLEI
jgi:hypothetical protein